MKLWDSAIFIKYTAITDEELDDKVRQIKLLHPNDGEVMMACRPLEVGAHSCPGQN